MRNGAMALLGGAAMAAAALASAAPRSWADGAVAVGTTGDVVRDGIAFGMVVNEPKEKAGETAIRRCRTFQARAAADRCRLVATFSGQCFAVAYDPQPGTPGAGWGIGPDQLAANLKAIAMCEETAGPARRGFCQVESGGCDTPGQKESSKAAPLPPAKSTVEDAKPVPQPPTKPEAKVATKTDTEAGAKEIKQETAKADTAAKPAPSAPAFARPEPVPIPAPKTLARAADGGRSAWHGAGSPLLPVGAMVAVGLAYGLGWLAKGKLKEGLAERQALVGGGLAVVSGVLVKVLDMAGIEQTVALVVVGAIALAAAVLA
jgi:hypothetical protein